MEWFGISQGGWMVLIGIAVAITLWFAYRLGC